ncbi:hypothetical protein [Streptomyces sp. NPDC004296]|uniref:hypothetical protein n=1 Tax=Streptomyces sp. NPDC004296 TaxID=3364697 RepID=UPI00368FDF32
MTPHSNCQEQQHSTTRTRTRSAAPVAGRPRQISAPAWEFAQAHDDPACWTAVELRTYADLGGIQ